MDVAIRVQAIRSFAVSEMAQLLEVYASTSQFSIMQDVLYAAAWLCGEFSSELKNPEQTLKSMLKYKSLPQHIESIFIHNILKLFARLVEKYEMNHEYDEIIVYCDLIDAKLDESIKSAELDVQERASMTLAIIQIVKETVVEKQKEKTIKLMDEDTLENGNIEDSNDNLLSAELLQLFSGELNPVAPKAQKKVPVPEGLDLDAWIHEPIEDSGSDTDHEYEDNLFIKSDKSEYSKSEKYQNEPTEEELMKIREARKLEQLNNPHYLKGATKKPEKNGNYYNVDNIPISELDLPIQLVTTGQKRSDKYLNIEKDKKKSKKRSKKSKKNKVESSSDEAEEAASGSSLMVNKNMELPEGATLSDSESTPDNPDDPHRALDIDLE
ncbi:hypothetical protein ILUMI_06486, partial [Ignelater luminosus]